MRVQRGDQHQRLRDIVGDARQVGFQLVHHMRGEARRRIPDEPGGLQHGVDDHRLEDVEFQVPLRAGHRHGRLVPHHLRRDHGQRLGLGRVGLAGHDAAGQAIGGDQKFGEAGARPAAQQADVVADLVERDRHRVQRAVQLHEGIMRAHSLEGVVAGGEGQAGQRGHAIREGAGEIGMAIEPRAGRGAALRQRHQPGQRIPQPRNAKFHLPRPSGGFLAEGHGHRIHHMGPPDLHDRRPFRRAARERGAQREKAGDGRVRHRLHRRDMHDGWKTVVGGLAAIDVVVRVDGPARIRRAERAVGQMRDHLIGVHVGLGAGSGLPHRQREFVIVMVGRDRGGGGRDGLGDGRGQFAKRLVRLRRRLLLQADGADQAWGKAFPADPEQPPRPFRLRAPEAICRDVDGAERIGLGAGGG